MTTLQPSGQSVQAARQAQQCSWLPPAALMTLSAIPFDGRSVAPGPTRRTEF